MIALVGFLVLCLAVSGIGGAVTATSVATWYPTLNKPLLTPPDWLFAPVWITLYILMAVAAWRVWRGAEGASRRRALTAFAVQLILNLLWSFLFFGFHWIGAALAEIVVLLAMIAVTAWQFRKVDRPAAAMFVPYLLWVAYATALTGAIWSLN